MVLSDLLIGKILYSIATAAAMYSRVLQLIADFLNGFYYYNSRMDKDIDTFYHFVL